MDPGRMALCQADGRVRRAHNARLGVAAPAVKPAATVVYLHYVDEQDRAVVEVIQKALAAQKYTVVGIELVKKGRISGDIRYVSRQDEKAALEVRSIAESVLAGEGFKLSLQPIVLDPSRYPGMKAGRVEVWIPSLSRHLPGQDLIQQQMPTPQEYRKK